MRSIRKLGIVASVVAIGGAALAMGLNAATAHAQPTSSITFVSATTYYSDTSFEGAVLGSDQVVLTFSVTCPAESASGFAQQAEVVAAADQGGNGGGSAGVHCTGSPQTVQVTATASISTYTEGGYAAGPAFIGGTLDLIAPAYANSETSQDVDGDVATTAGMQTITEGAAAS
ncbi:MAG TPA: hypothetical protein VN969_27540 [Streptosporangiaceae bacterium]|nr:hypothetical protein [Streptosporangiaceae bacterium]